jgi:hypothetical protein
MQNIIAVAVIAVMTAGAGVAFAQTPQEQIDAALAKALEAGIPVSLLESKIAEGKAKGIPMDRIAAAVEHRAAGLAKAQAALSGQTDVGPADLAVGADAIEAGVSEAVLSKLAVTVPRERRVVAIAALEQLVSLGHAPASALERVQEALKRGPEALLNLPAQAAAPRGTPSDSAPGPGSAPGAGSAGPPAGVPAPGEPSQSARPEGRGPTK